MQLPQDICRLREMGALYGWGNAAYNPSVRPRAGNSTGRETAKPYAGENLRLFV